jgi:transposase-like protein
VAAAPILRPGPRAGTDYPSSLSQFLDWFHTDDDCAAYLARLRWPDGFSCARCGPSKAWLTKRHLYVCAKCGRQTSITSGTIFEKTRLPLLTWFRAIWMLTSSKSGVSAKELERELGISYRAAWLVLHKLRRAMVRPGRDADKLSGDIEVDESYLGGPVPGGKRGRGAEGKVVIAIAVERKGLGKKSKRWKLGRTRIQVIPDTTAKTLLDFVEDTCENGSTIYTDGLSAYRGLARRGYTHDATAISNGNDPAHVVLPAVHRVASLLKRWLMGTHHGGWGAQHVEVYLDEFIFRFNRRQSNARGLLFYRLLQNAVAMRKINYEGLILLRKAQTGKRRGVARTRRYGASAITNTPAPRRTSSSGAQAATAARQLSSASKR